MKSKRIASLAAAGVLTLTLTGCGHDNNRDLKGVNNTDPDYVVNILNMDGQPNVAVLCFKGVAMLTTTRQYNALTLAPKLDAFCDTKRKP